MEKNFARYLPDGMAWARAAVSSIPMVGSALDHLVFDKADAIRVRNLEAAIASMAAQLEHVNESAIDKDWFSSDEALAAFKILSDKASYEPDGGKVDALGKIVAACGSKQHSTDSKKLSVVEHLSRLSTVQIKLLRVIANTEPKEKTINTGSIEQKATAIWSNDIVATLRAGEQFWAGTLALDQELDVLESLNTIRRVHLFSAPETAYQLTSIGKRAASYVRTAGL